MKNFISGIKSGLSRAFLPPEPEHTPCIGNLAVAPSVYVPVVEEEPEIVNSLINMESVMQNLNHDAGLVTMIMKMFLKKHPVELELIREAIEKQDAHALKVTAHTLKGAIGNFTTEGPYQTALKLERMGQDDNLGSAELLCEKLGKGLSSLEQEVQEYLSVSNQI